MNNFINRIKLQYKLLIIILSLVSSILIISYFSLNGMFKLNSSMKSVYEDRVVPLKDLKIISDMYAVNIVDTYHKVRSKTITVSEGLKNLEFAQKTIDEKWKKYISTYLTEEEKRKIDDVKIYFEKANIFVDKINRIFLEGNLQALTDEGVRELYLTIDPLTEKINELMYLQLEISKLEYDKGVSIYNKTKIFILYVLSFLAFFVTILLILVFSFISYSNRQTHEIFEGLNKVSDSGNLVSKIQIFGEDELSKIGLSINNLISRLFSLIKNIKLSSVDLDSQVDILTKSSKELKSVTQSNSLQLEKIKENFNFTNESIQSIASTMEEMIATINEISKNTLKSSQLAQQSVSQNENAKLVISKLSSSAEKVAEISSMIGKIASQTNLLALNATIEAARAGEAGKGFAVVASEVKELAKQSSSFSQQINQIINDIQSQSHSTVNVVHSIGESVLEISQMVSSIASAIEEQSVAIKEIGVRIQESSDKTNEMTISMENLSLSNTKLSDSVNHLKETSSNLSDLSKKLTSDVSFFTT